MDKPFQWDPDFAPTADKTEERNRWCLASPLCLILLFVSDVGYTQSSLPSNLMSAITVMNKWKTLLMITSLMSPEVNHVHGNSLNSIWDETASPTRRLRPTQYELHNSVWITRRFQSTHYELHNLSISRLMRSLNKLVRIYWIYLVFILLPWALAADEPWWRSSVGRSEATLLTVSAFLTFISLGSEPVMTIQTSYLSEIE